MNTSYTTLEMQLSVIEARQYGHDAFFPRLFSGTTH